MSDFLTHGRILGGTIGTPDLAAALTDYRDRLGLTLVESGSLPADLAASWGCPANAGARHAVLQPTSGMPAFLRLVEQPLPDAFMPTRTFGWAAFEITVQEVFEWPGRLTGSGFDVIGPPREIPGLPFFVAMQMLGRGREMIYLNEVRSDMPNTDLARAGAPVDHIFIVILATPDRAATMDWYRDRLGLHEADRHVIPYTMISRAFGLPLDTLHGISMAQAGRLPVVEIDDYPSQATERPRAPGQLPPGNGLVTLAVDSFDRPDLDYIAPPVSRPGAAYGGRRTATVVGSAGELIELVEI